MNVINIILNCCTEKENLKRVDILKILVKVKKYISLGERNTRYHDRTLSNEQKPSIYNLA